MLLERKYKDRTPYETITYVRRILDELGIVTYKHSWNEISACCYSVRVEVDGFPGVGTNGKGVSRMFALASAYGELLERLQNKKLMHKFFGLKHRDTVFPDEVRADLANFARSHPEVISELIRDHGSAEFAEMVKRYPALSTFVRYRDYFADSEQLLPSRLISMRCGTNGMCAGNTSYEALSHGICEIMERYVSRCILERNAELPDIPLENITDPSNRSIIEILLHGGYDVRVKDCTLGGKFPVLGVLLLNKAKTHYQFRLGSECVFDIALERCLTEVMQGHDLHTLKQSLLPVRFRPLDNETDILNELSKISKNGSGQFPSSIFSRPQATDTYSRAFLPCPADNKENFEHLTSILKQNGYKLYIRNLSFLSFPTYKIYIPGMSEIFYSDTEGIGRSVRDSYVAKHLLNLFECSPRELRTVASELEKFILRTGLHRIQDTPYFKTMNLHLDTGSGFRSFDLRLLVSILNYINGDTVKSARWFSEFMESISGTSYVNSDYYRCVSAMLEYRAAGMNDAQTEEKLSGFFSPATVGDVLGDFSERSVKILQGLSLPKCPDCESCAVRSGCKWPEWNSRTTELDKKLNTFNNYISIS